MKVNLFQQAPYRFMPAGFEDGGIPSVVKPPYAELVEPRKMFDSYQWFIDELLAGVRAGFDGVAVTEHGQTSYDMTPNPNLPAAVLAHAIRSERPETALIVLGRSLGKTTEPLRIAEEYSMLDVMSGGRLVAGLPVGLSYDANLNNGIPTVETRDRYREAVELMFRSWTDEAPFTWNGRFSQYSLGELVAASSAAASAAGVGAGVRLTEHDAMDHRSGPCVRLPRLVRPDAHRATHL